MTPIKSVIPNTPPRGDTEIQGTGTLKTRVRGVKPLVVQRKEDAGAGCDLVDCKSVVWEKTAPKSIIRPGGILWLATSEPGFIESIWLEDLDLLYRVPLPILMFF